MKKLGFLLLIVAAVAAIGAFLWTIISEADSTPVIVFVIIGCFGIGFLILLGVAIRDRQRQKKNEDFKGVNN
ncbi:MAG: hypothetical protein ABIB93_04005 [Chloroflexota bacterium]